jgi:hypothetical protein
MEDFILVTLWLVMCIFDIVLAYFSFKAGSSIIGGAYVVASLLLAVAAILRINGL